MHDLIAATGELSRHRLGDNFGRRFERECESLGVQSAAARLRLDEKGPQEYRKAFAAYRGPRAFPSYFERKWLSLRLSAVKRGMVVDSNVTPSFLESITDGRCPVTLQTLVTEGRSPQNPSVDRLVNEVSYRAGNICVMSLRANRAKADRSFEEVAAIAEAGETRYGLEPVEWMRLTSLMYGAWAHAYKKADPHLVPLATIPGRGLFLSTSQVVQLLLTRHFAGGSKNEVAATRWLELTRESGCPEPAFFLLMSNLRRALAGEHYPGDAWLHGEVFDAFVTWYNACGPAVIPTVEGLLDKHQAHVADPVATLEWHMASRQAT